MSENQNAEAQQPVPPLVINGQYIKDLSFEVPAAPGIFADLNNTAPEINVHVDVSAQTLHNNVHEVVLTIKAVSTLKLGDKPEDTRPVFMVDLAYAGLFTLNVPEEHIQGVLLVDCAHILFPFARNIIANATRDGAFPPLLLQPIDFVQLFNMRMAQASAEANAAQKN